MNYTEGVFYSHLTDVDSLDVIVKEGFSLDVCLEVIPTELGRKLTTWCIKYYFENGRKVAPSKEAIMATWGDQLTPLEIEINDDTETDSIEWAIATLRTDYADYQAGQFATKMVTDVRNADGPDRASVVLQYSQLLHQLSQSLITRKSEMIGADGISDALSRYAERATDGHKYKGMILGLPEVDKHMFGIHPGEICVFAGTSGGGKSWMAGYATVENFKRGLRTMLFTLENDVEMTFDRLACIEARVDYEHWQRGECNENDLLRVKSFLSLLEASDKQPIIVQPGAGERTAAAMIRRAIVEDVDAIIIDQLTFIERAVGSRARERKDIVAEIMRDTKNLISEGRKVPCLILHQINRKGREEARKTGRFLMDHLGESTEVENSASFVFAIYQSPDHETAELAELQMLKSRRTIKKDWEVVWRPARGDVRVKREVEHD